MKYELFRVEDNDSGEDGGSRGSFVSLSRRLVESYDSGGREGEEAWKFVESFLGSRRRPWQRFGLSGKVKEDSKELKGLDTAVYRFLEMMARDGIMDAATFLDTASLYTVDAVNLLELCISSNPSVLDSVFAALSQLIISLSDLIAGEGNLDPADDVFFVADSADMLRWLPNVVRVEDVLGDEPVQSMRTLASFYNQLVPLVCEKARSTSWNEAQIRHMAAVARLGFALCGWKILQRLRGNATLGRVLDYLPSAGDFGSAMQSKFDLAQLATASVKAPVVHRKELRSAGPYSETSVDKNWYLGRVVDKDGYLYDDDVDDEEEVDPLNVVEAPTEVDGEESEGGADETNEKSQSARIGGRVAGRGRGRSGPVKSVRGGAHKRGGGVRISGEERGEATQSSSRGGRGGSSGGASATSHSTTGPSARGRASKEKNKSAVANHHRKDRATRKQGFGP